MFRFSILRILFLRFCSFALQPQGILGPMFGQIGKILVGFKWKDKKVLRSYVIPANPQSSAQTAQREIFYFCQQIATVLTESICKPFWNYLSSAMSGFNKFISINVKRVSDWVDFANIVVTSGSYESLASFVSAEYTTGTGALVLTWTDTISSVGNANDQVVALALDRKDWDPDNDKKILIAYTDTTKKRSDTTVTLSLPTGLTPSNIECYLGLRNPTTESKIQTANSLYLQATAP